MALAGYRRTLATVAERASMSALHYVVACAAPLKQPTSSAANTRVRVERSGEENLTLTAGLSPKGHKQPGRAGWVVLCIAITRTDEHSLGGGIPAACSIVFHQRGENNKKQFSRGADMSKIREANGTGQYVLAAIASTPPEWPLIERRRNDRRKSDRRQPDRVRPPVSALHAPKVVRSCTPRERQVLALLLQGMSNKQIAQTLGIAEDTVKKHLQHVYRKLEVHRRALLMIGVPAHSWADTPSVE